MGAGRGVRVVCCVPHYPPASRVGAWISTHECLAHLVTLGHQVEVHTYYASSSYTLDGVRVMGRHQMPDPGDVVVSHLGDRGQGAELADRWQVPSVRMVHGRVDRAAERLDGSALVVFNSRASATEVGWDGPQIVVHPPINPADFRVVPGDRVTLVNLTRSKGGLVFRRLAHHMTDTKFLAVRGGYGTQIVTRSPNVDTVDTVEDIRQVLSRTAVLLMPSLAESYGRVGVEALCSGIPVVAHPTPGLREALGDAAQYADRTDTLAWADAIRSALTDYQWRAKALARSATLDPAGDLDRFAEAVTATTRQEAAA